MYLILFVSEVDRSIQSPIEPFARRCILSLVKLGFGGPQPIPENGINFHSANFFTILQAIHLTAMSEINRIIRGRKLTKYRELRDLTKEDMATRLGVSPNTYGRYEKGEFEPKMDQWEKIADILNVPVEELLKTEPIVINMTNSHGPNVSGTRAFLN